MKGKLFLSVYGKFANLMVGRLLSSIFQKKIKSLFSFSLFLSLFILSFSVSFASGGTITYTDSSGLNPRSSPAYVGGYVVETFTTTGTTTFTVPSGVTTVDYLVVGGGGGGGTGSGGGAGTAGGGGAGRYYVGTSSVTSGSSVTVTVGAGGGAGGVGNNSIFHTITAEGGGYGAAQSGAGGNGGSGGGGGSSSGASGSASGAGGSGNNGASGGVNAVGGGGGGAGGVGNAPVTGTHAGDGGSGLSSSINGSSVSRAGGGAGAGAFAVAGGTATSGGGNGGAPAGSGSAATVNTGGGGGGGSTGGGAGGSGIVIVRYLYSNPTPTLTSATSTAITNTTATLGATITSGGDSSVTSRGVCYGLTPSPTTNCTAEGGTATGTYTQLITGLTSSTTYYYRGYATNSYGTAYSSDGTFTTQNYTTTYTDSSGLNPRSSPAYIGGYVVEIFTSTGTFAVPSNISSVGILVVGGGGGASSIAGGGGGAGGVVSSSNISVTPGSSVSILVGGGGAGANNGGDSSFGSTIAHGGGRGYGSTAASSGGSGGGGSAAVRTDGWNFGPYANGIGNSGSYNPVEGYAGGTGSIPGCFTWPGGNGTDWTVGSGGGGAGGVGVNGACGFNGTNGGIGITSSISGTSTQYAGGGGGGGSPGSNGSGSYGGGTNSNGTSNTGGGAGAGSNFPTTGGSGVVIIRYAYIDSNFPVISTPTATSTLDTSVVLGANVTSIGGSSITARGTCYGTTPAPTTNCTAEGGTGTGVFTHTRTGLASSTTYYYRGYATNSYGTAYSSDGIFITEGVTNSLMFDSSQSQYLSRTSGATVTSNTVWTYSGWVKRGTISAANSMYLLGAGTHPGTDQSSIKINADNTLEVVNYISSSVKTRKITNQLFRDPSAWYHIVVTSNGATSLKIYVNGNEITSFSLNTGPDASTWTLASASTLLGIGYITSAAQYFDGYISDTNFVDGQVLPPTSFGKPDSITGNWIPKAYNGTYGVNGFHLNFSSSTTLGKDSALISSPHTTANNWTLNGGISSSTNQVIDTPLNNFATLNPIYPSGGTRTFTKGNLEITGGILNYNSTEATNIQVRNGKYYWEGKLFAPGTASITSIAFGGWNYYADGSGIGGSSYTTNDVIGMAADVDNNTISFYKNGVLQATKTFSIPVQIYGDWPALTLGGAATPPSWSLNFGQKAFAYTPPTGFKSLSTANLPVSTITKPNQHFDTVTYTGNGITQSISNLNFQPDLVWLKSRNLSGDAEVYDSVRGATKYLLTDWVGPEGTVAQAVTSFNSNGFSLGTGSGSNDNTSGTNYVAWNWKAGNGTTTNTAGSITSIVSANPNAGFSVVTYTGTGVNATVGHGLGATPKMIIVKNRTNGTYNWHTWHSSLTSPAYFFKLSTTEAQGVDTTVWNSTAPNSTVLNLGTFAAVNGNANNYVAYVWSEVPGYSKFGSYTGNGSADGPFVYTGFKPRYVMIKRTDSVGDWIVQDTARSTYNPSDTTLYPHLNAVEGNGGGYPIDINSNGFKIRNSATYMNTNTGTYIYAAFAESSMVPTYLNLPSVSTPTVTGISDISAVLGATVDSIGGASITARGTCWGTTPAPTTNCTSEGNTTTGTFTHTRTDLASSTTYYYRGYVTNPSGTFFSTDGTFTTSGVKNSLLFDSSQSQYLSRIPSVTGNQKTWTWSVWVKPSKFGAVTQHLFNAYSGVNDYCWTSFSSNGWYSNDDTISFASALGGGQTHLLKTTAVFRDPSAWQHLVFVVDTTQAVASDRISIYVNGMKVTLFTTATYPTQNSNIPYMNVSGIAHKIGYLYNGGFDGYMSDVNFVDGQALTPTSFGKADSNTGNWIPKAYTGTYGTNGFHLNFSNSTSLGADVSGNGNTWTINGGITAVNNQVIDTPLNNFATLNPIDGGSTLALKAGNLGITTGVTSGTPTGSTFWMSSGKWYWENKYTGTNGDGSAKGFWGIRNQGTTAYYVYYGNDGYKYNISGSQGAYGSTYTAGDVVGVAFDADAGTLTFYKNGVSQGVAFSGLTNGPYTTYYDDGSSSSGLTGGSINFGQKAFVYVPPTGFKSLSTANLPVPTILKPNQYFDAVTYTGNSSTQSISNLNFQPDLVWVKTRNDNDQHILVDSIRGVGNVLSSSQTNADQSLSSVSAFNSNGFSVNGSTNNGWSTNRSAVNYVAWNWKAGNSITTNTAGSITSTVSANPNAGFSVVTYSGNSTNSTVGHGLGQTPKMIIVKQRNGTGPWAAYFNDGSDIKSLYMNQTDADTPAHDAGLWNSLSPTNSVINLGTSNSTNGTGGTYVAYAFAEVPGYSKFGSYTGNGSADGPFVYTGFKPKYIMVKRVDSTSPWIISDTVRDTKNPNTLELYAENYASEGVSTGRYDILSNGFKVRVDGATAPSTNASGGTYIYVAFADTNMVPTYPNLPSVSTPTVTGVSDTSAVLGATVDSVGGASLTARGTCWGSTQAPTTNCTAEGGTGTGVFTQSRTGLASSTTYYYRGYATNSYGTTYSSDGTFTTVGVVSAGSGVTSTTTYTSNSTFTVPVGVTSVTIKTWGAGGILYYGHVGAIDYSGGGGFAKGDIAVTPGQSLVINVGVSGGTTPSGVFLGSMTQANSLVVAGSGGNSGYSVEVNVPGGAGGGTTGGTADTVFGGTGGTSGAGGTGGSDNGGYTYIGNCSYDYAYGSNGVALSGGRVTNGSYGDGGAGYWGGGGGGYADDTNCDGGGWFTHGGGGGGSSFATSSAANVTLTSGSGSSVANSGDVNYVSGKGNGVSGNSISSAGQPGLVVISYTGAVAPTIVSPTTTLITNNSGIISADVSTNITGGTSILARGICWGTTSSPTTNCSDSGSTATGTITQTITGLPANTLIYYRGYATNSVGLVYSEDGTLTTTLPTRIDSYHLRKDNGDEVSATYSLSENTPSTSNFVYGDKIRFRFAVSNQGLIPSANTYQIEYATSSCTSWAAVPRPSEVTNQHFRMETSPFVGDSTGTTHSNGITIPIGKTFRSGRVQTFNNSTYPIALASNEYTEIEYLLRSTTNTALAIPYCFRLTNGGNSQDFTYSVTPQITVMPKILRYQGGGGGGWGGAASLSNSLESAAIVATTSVTGGGADGDITSTSTSVESTSTPGTQQSTTTPTRKRGGGGSVGLKNNSTTLIAQANNPNQGMVLGASTESMCTNMTHRMLYGSDDTTTHGEVSQLQYYLQSKGYFDIKVTGMFLGITENAVKEFQKDNNLIVTGIAGKVTRDKIKSLGCININ